MKKLIFSLLIVLFAGLGYSSEIDRGVRRIRISGKTLPASGVEIVVPAKTPVLNFAAMELQNFLKKAGIAAVGHASDGVEALARLDSAEKNGQPFDFVFSDFWMPNMNGLEFIEKLRADPRLEHLPVFAVTADTECHNDARSGLFTGVLLKPLTYGKLLAVFASVNDAKTV